MFGPPGRAYVYLIYGVHFCLNVVCGSEGSGQAVLLRAVEPLIGLEDMWRRRFEGEAVSGERVRSDARKLASGPGKICQAFSVTRERDDGASLEYSDLRVLPSNEARPITLARDRRIGISRAAEKLRRFADAESRFLSRGLSQHAEFFEA
jgi:DNA-3-methyladenine glycosylase